MITVRMNPMSKPRFALQEPKFVSTWFEVCRKNFIQLKNVM